MALLVGNRRDAVNRLLNDKMSPIKISSWLTALAAALYSELAKSIARTELIMTV